MGLPSKIRLQKRLNKIKIQDSLPCECNHKLIPFFFPNHKKNHLKTTLKTEDVIFEEFYVVFTVSLIMSNHASSPNIAWLVCFLFNQ